jgi:lipid-A-disaccharide synthase-like uncharacterized protein
MRSKEEIRIGHIMGYIGATVLFIRFVPLLYEQFANPREINLYFLYLEMLASILCGLSAIFLEAIPLFVANSLSCFCVILVLIIQFRIRYYKSKNLKTQNKEDETIIDDNILNENTLTTTKEKKGEFKNVAKDANTNDLISKNKKNEKFLQENKNEFNEQLKPSYVPLYQISELEKPEQITEVYPLQTESS